MFQNLSKSSHLRVDLNFLHRFRVLSNRGSKKLTALQLGLVILVTISSSQSALSSIPVCNDLDSYKHCDSETGVATARQLNTAK